MPDDRRLIEDYLPIVAIGEAATGEPRTKGHISTLHVWRARRPLTACRAAVYGALVPAEQFAPRNGPENKRHSLGRANAAQFVKHLCTYPSPLPVPMQAVKDAQQHILEAHAARLTAETGHRVTIEDIRNGKAPRPRVLDMFAGGGAIPLEAARLGCESHAVDLNPVAHLIELCTVDFPQRFGPGLADEIEKWGKIVLDRTQEAVADVLARIPRPKIAKGPHNPALRGEGEAAPNQEYLSVVAYYWSRTAPCPNPQCQGTVPLYRQTWLRKKDSGFVALKATPDKKRRVVRYDVVHATTESGLGFDPGEGSEGSSTVCPFCQASLEGSYVRKYGAEKGFGQQLMCVIALNPDGTGKLYLTDESLADGEAERQAISEKRANQIELELGASSLDQAIPPTGNAGLDTGNSYLYGINTFRQMFTPRQRLLLLTMAREIHKVHKEMVALGIAADRAKALATYLGIWLSRTIDRCNSLCRWNGAREVLQGLTDMKRFAMMWDFPEVNIFSGASGDAMGNLEYITATVRREAGSKNPVSAVRGSATELPYEAGYFDAVITDPPYYNNESYSELSDVSYVWLRPTIGFLYPEHFAGALTPKKKEAVAAAYRQGGKKAARDFYENSMLLALQEAHRVSKSSGVLVVVYAHKTTLGWATLVDAMRRAGFTVTEAWPIEMEGKARIAHIEDAALRSSIVISSRKRAENTTGSYDETVRPELEQIVRERVTALWEMGVGGADLVISCVGAGLRAFTRHARVEFANGEEVPAERFLAEVETVVLDSILTRLSKEAGGNGNRQTSLAGVDPATRFYILWRYTYRWVELEAGEAIVFANGTHVELDGQGSLSQGSRALVEKKKGKYRLLDFTDRGSDDDLGIPGANGTQPPLVDSLHRVLWLMENRPRDIGPFLRDSRVNREQLRLAAQALAGPALKGGAVGDISPSKELAALAKLAANWRSVIEDAAMTADEKIEKADRKIGQAHFTFDEGNES